MNQGTTPARILVVDDQETNVQVVGTMLDKLGYEIVPASDGEQALRRLSLRAADLILLDLLMPGMDGFEVCRRIMAHPEWKEIPIIFLSAADDKSMIVRALETGGVDYVTKPFNQAELVSRVRTHLALKLTRDRLRQLAEDKDELLGILAHDLKNHLGGMKMSAQLLHDRSAPLGDKRIERMSANILHATDQMVSFVNEFLANSSADRGLTLRPEAISLRQVAEATLHQYLDAAQRKEIKLHLEASGNDTVLADQAALEQVLENLLSNALKFSPPEKNIWITVEPASDGGTVCRIKDEGPGFTEEDRALMFRRYRRLSARPTAGEPSTGLGLSIVQKLVLSMNGELTCESSPNQGATFILRLPPVSSTF
jgi:two-component system, sensor histidine kinase and response regulator